jgi:hypothetical protein
MFSTTQAVKSGGKLLNFTVSLENAVGKRCLEAVGKRFGCIGFPQSKGWTGLLDWTLGDRLLKYTTHYH